MNNWAIMITTYSTLINWMKTLMTMPTNIVGTNKGSVPTISKLPTRNTNGDLYIVNNTNIMMIWISGYWITGDMTFTEMSTMLNTLAAAASSKKPTLTLDPGPGKTLLTGIQTNVNQLAGSLNGVTENIKTEMNKYGTKDQRGAALKNLIPKVNFLQTTLENTTSGITNAMARFI